MNRSNSPDGRLEQIARRQHQVFSYRQAISVGHTPTTVHRRLATGRWIELTHHVFALPSGPSTWRRQYKAAELSVRDSALSGLAACKLHALRTSEPSAPRSPSRTRA